MECGTFSQATVPVCSVACRFPISVHLNDINRKKKTFLEIMSCVGSRTKSLNDGPLTVLNVITLRK